MRELPTDLSGGRLLEIVPAGTQGTASSALAERGAEKIVESDRPQELLGGDGSFDYILCRDVLRSSPYPMALLADLWDLAAPGAVLLLDAEVVPEPEHSGYARFTPAASSEAGWVPGRLALRWMVEVSGFDVERWLGEPDAAASPRACLRAIRAERTPARSAPPPMAARR